jgi:hypothetical protein
MFRKILESIMKWLEGPTHYENLEAYIAAGNPQNAHDIDRLEREFIRKNQSSLFTKYY